MKVWEGRAVVQPDRTFESFSPARDTSQERFSVFLPLSADVRSSDRISIRGQMYEIDGEPKQFAQTRLRHIQLTVWRAIR
ncbi:hypothetical protein [Streptomyces wuyuanensis]|uniref:hypothetical protein n=1 Tax=Streptomyces wuyuanensis TaxID=1196353 RepID=UPI003434AB98